MKSIILKTATRLLSSIVLVFAVFLLWRGHHSPGGGFIAALVAGTGFALVALAEGPASVRGGLSISPQHLMGIGVILAVGSGIPGVIRQLPFLTGVWWPAENPWAGTPLFFDAGVFLVVLGAILMVLLELEQN